MIKLKTYVPLFLLVFQAFFCFNLERGTGPPASSSLLLECLDLDLRFFSFFDFLDLDFDLFDSPSSSSLLEESDDELEELESDDLLLECCKVSFYDDE
ncbi:hypothetical protein OWV82_007101 [Melia azedarach]|uniref:Uncharacterized protein n=1 Tax=Melia azedarach TaxID=155640 RepID=A0ACC1YJX5_MELAZ|nr:hypothetical protein OWV82_007101 [Melia azedarach]